MIFMSYKKRRSSKLSMLNTYTYGKRYPLTIEQKSHYDAMRDAQANRRRIVDITVMCVILASLYGLYMWGYGTVIVHMIEKLQ